MVEHECKQAYKQRLTQNNYKSIKTSMKEGNLLEL